MDGLLSDVIDLVGEARKGRVDTRGEEVIVHLVEQVAEGRSVAITAGYQLSYGDRELLFDSFFQDAATHDRAGSKEREEVAAGSLIEIAVGIFRRS